MQSIAGDICSRWICRPPAALARAHRYCNANGAVQTVVQPSQRISFCNCCRNLHLVGRKPTIVMPPPELSPRSSRRKSSGELPGRAGTPVAKLCATTTPTGPPSGASREKNEGRGCLAEGVSCAGQHNRDRKTGSKIAADRPRNAPRSSRDPCRYRASGRANGREVARNARVGTARPVEALGRRNIDVVSDSIRRID